MTWWYNTENGALTNYTGPAGEFQEFGLDIDSFFGNTGGWHELPIPATDTETQAAAEAQKLYPTGKAPTTNLLNQATSNVPGLSTIEQFSEFPLKILGWISDRENIVRVVKVIVGSIMMLVGMDMLVKDTTNIDVSGAIKTAAMTAVM
jgi:hypothetical protein